MKIIFVLRRDDYIVYSKDEGGMYPHRHFKSVKKIKKILGLKVPALERGQVYVCSQKTAGRIVRKWKKAWAWRSRLRDADEIVNKESWPELEELRALMDE